MKTAIVLKGETLGNGDNLLGQQLMGSFLRKLWASRQKPDFILFYNSAVKLLGSSSSVLDALEGLSNAGVDLIACGTCIGFYRLKDSMVVGRVSDMKEIVDILLRAEKVVTP
ncbi:MAG TPA: DsrE family protein [Terriglobia bacterium]|nr:DsrE family protein [Terriglobia bacterium]